MKKLQLFGLVALLAVGLTAAPAGAFTFAKGKNLGKFSDYGSIYSPNGSSLAFEPTNFAPVGDWDQTIFTITNLYEPATQIGANQYYSGSSPQLLGMVYDLKVLGFSGTFTLSNGDTGVSFSLGDAGRFTSLGYGVGDTGGRLDLWQNTANSFTPLQNPNNWGYGTEQAAPFASGGYDTFPTLNDNLVTDTPVLSGTFVAPDNTVKIGGVPVVTTITLDLTAGTGSTSQMYLQLLYGQDAFATKYLPDGDPYQISLQEDFTFLNLAQTNDDVLDPGVAYTKDMTNDVWNLESNDPARFSIIPEPATMSLLSMALVGLGGLIRKRRIV